MLDVLNTIADVEVFVAFGLSLVFTGAYMVFFNWRSTRAGRAIMYLFLSWIAVTTISFLAVWIGPDYWLRPLWRMLGWGAVIYALVNLVLTLVHYFFKKPEQIRLEARHTSDIPVVKDES